MKNNTKIILGLVLAILIGLALYFEMKEPESVLEDNSVVVTTPDIKGCYVATLAKDVYTINIQSQSDEDVSGVLVFKNFEKDSSTGTFDGVYEDGILFGNYVFNSEGMTSDMEVIFKRSGTDFVRGFGEVNAAGNAFVEATPITYDDSVVFKATSASCAINLD